MKLDELMEIWETIRNEEGFEFHEIGKILDVSRTTSWCQHGVNSILLYASLCSPVTPPGSKLLENLLF